MYEFPGPDAPIRQGDIFVGVPRINLTSLEKLSVFDKEETKEGKWSDLANAGKPIPTVVSLEPVSAIVVTQDCDTLRSNYITLCEIKPFPDFWPKETMPSSPKGWVERIRSQSAKNYKWFYLAPNETLGFGGKMVADFILTIRLPRVSLEGLRSLRKGRLMEEPDEHFRERLSEFFRRYPYNEWYPFNRDEFLAYEREQKGEVIKPYPWQEPPPVTNPPT